MAGFILDASVAAAWCFSDEQSEFSNALAERHNLTFYDAAYLDLALQHQLPLASIDGAFNRAAGEAGVS